MIKFYNHFRSMKLVLGLIGCFIVFPQSSSHAQKTWDGGAATLNWEDGDNWNPNGVPVAGDAVTISAGTDLTVNLSSSQTITSLTVQFNNVNAAGTVQLVMSAAADLTVTGAVNITNSSTGGTNMARINVGAGRLTSATITQNASLGDTRDDELIISTGTVNCLGNLTMSGAAARNLTQITGAGILRIGGTNTGGTFAVNAAGSTVEYNGDAAQSVRGGTYHHLITSLTAASTANRTKTSGAAITVEGNLTVLSNHPTNVCTFNAAGNNLTITGTTTVQARGFFLDDADGGINTYNGLITVDPSATFQATVNTNTNRQIFRNGILNNGTFNVRRATFNTNSQTISGAGSTEFGTGGAQTDPAFSITGDISITNNLSGVLSIVGNLARLTSGTNVEFINGINSYLRYSGAAAPMAGNTFTANANPNTVEYARSNNTQTIGITEYHHLIISGTGTNQTKNINSSLTVNGDFTYSFNTTGASQIHNANGQTLTVGGNFNVTAGILAGLNNGTTTDASTISIGKSYVQTGGVFRGVINQADLTMTVADSFIVSGGTFDFSSNFSGFTYVQVAGHFINTSGIITWAATSTVTTDPVYQSRIELNGSSTQNIQGGGTWDGTATALQRGRLVLNNSGIGGFQMVGTTPVNVANLQLLNGVVTSTTSAYFNITGSAAGAVYGTFSSGSSIEGRLERAITNSRVYNYPLKKGLLFQTLSFTTATAGNTGSLGYELFNSNTGGTFNTFFFSGLLNNGMYWKADASAGSLGTLSVSAISPLSDVNTMASSATLTGTYSLLGGKSVDPVISEIPFSLTSSTIYMALGTVANLSGIIPVGNSHTLTKLTTIAAALNAMTVSGNVIFELQADYDGTIGETFPINFYQFRTSGGAHYATVRPAAGVTGRQTSNSSVGTASAQIIFNGVDRLTFDGRPGGAGSAREWIFWNANTAQSTFRIVNGSDTIVIRNLNLASQNASAASNSTAGIIRLDVPASPDGSLRNITIQDCKFYSPNTAHDSRWVSGIVMYATGAGAAEISNINITNCEFDNMSVAAGSKAAVFGNDTTRIKNIYISGNSIYQSENSTFASSSGGRITNALINLTARNVFIRNNYLGGKERYCGGGPFTVAAPAANNAFFNIRLMYINTSVSDSLVIENNIMQNIDFEGITGGGSFEPVVNGVIVQYGGPSRIVGNIIGDPTGATNILVKVRNTFGSDQNAAGVRGFDLDFATTVSGIFERNTVTNIKLRHLVANHKVTLQFEGLRVGNTAQLRSIRNNTINEIDTDISSPNVILKQRGIDFRSTSSCVIESNTLGNFKNNASGVAYTVGANTFIPECTGLFVSVANSSNSNLIITKNKIYNFESAVQGLTVAAVNLDMLPAGASSLTVLANNMITMGYGNSSDVKFVGVYSGTNNPAPAKVNFVFNNILITGPGAGASAAQNSYAVLREGAGNTTPFFVKNNIVYNNRLQGNAETHLTFALDETTEWQSERNLFFAGNQATPPVASPTLAKWGATIVSDLAGWQAAGGQDPSPSFVGPVYFFDPANGNLTPLGSNLCNLYSNIAEPITSPYAIVDDHFNVSRSPIGPSPGAVEFNAIGYWMGIKSTEWNDPQNWCNGVVPDSTIIVYIVDIFQPTPRWYPIINNGTVGNCKDIIITNGLGGYLGTQAVCTSPLCVYPTHGSYAQNSLMPFTNLAAKLTIGNQGKLRVHGEMLFHTVPSSDSSFIHNAGTIEFAGRTAVSATQSVPEYSKYKNVMITGDNIKVMQGDVSIADTLTINAVPALSLANHSLIANGVLLGTGELIGAVNSNLTIGGTSGGDFGTLRFRNVGQGQSLNNLNFTRTGLNASVQLGSAVNIQNKLLINEGLYINNGFNTTVLKDMEVGTNAAHTGNGKVIFANTASNTSYQMIGNGNFGNVEINDGNGLTENVTIINNPTVNDISILNGRLLPQNNTLTVTGNWTRPNLPTQNNFVEATSTIIFNGPSTQTITRPSDTGESYYNYIVNKPSGNVMLSNGTDLNIKNSLTLTQGHIMFANLSDTVKMNIGATIIGGSTASYINGKTSCEVASTANTTCFYPIGKNVRYRPVTLTFEQTVATATRYTAEMLNGAAPIFNIIAPITNVSGVRHFIINQVPTNPLTTGVVTLTYGSDDDVAQPALLRVAKSQGTDWMNLGGTGSGIPAFANSEIADQSITSTVNFTGFSAFLLANEGGNNPLPLELLEFTARPENDDVMIKWNTRNETNTSTFVVERSLNGIDFEAVATVNAAGNSNFSSYEHLDTDVVKYRANKKLYYRLLQTDIDGAHTYSKVVAILFEAGYHPYFNLYPNPFQSSLHIDLAVTGAEVAGIKLVNLSGTTVHTTELHLSKGVYQGSLEIPGSVAKGLYLLHITTPTEAFVQKVIKY